jgi:hypothetical protein
LTTARQPTPPLLLPVVAAITSGSDNEADQLRHRRDQCHDPQDVHGKGESPTGSA